jgi:hypothetical protein
MSGIRARWVVLAILGAALLVVPLGRVVRSLVMTRGAMSTFTRLISAGNAQDVNAIRSLCSKRYLASVSIQVSREGGVIGFPRNIHKNFQIWTEGDEVRLCPTDREGPVYRLLKEEDAWKFDGLAGLLKRGRVEPQELDLLP